MTTRRSVSLPYNLWNDGQRVDKPDMDTEQDRNINSDAAIVQNHLGSGVVVSAPLPRIIFDSDNLDATQAALVASDDFDGTGISPTLQPSDTNLGNQLQVTLSGSDAFGRLSVKVAIFGLDFQGNPQYDTFYFYTNETQVTEKHYSRVLSIFFNDFKGNSNCSRNLGGRVVISQTDSYQLSRDEIMVAQDVEPNLFFRDFKVSNFIISPNNTVTLFQALQTGIGPEFSVDSFNINTNVKRNVFLVEGDVTTKLGQKFQAETNNIQKVTLLLGVSPDDNAALANRYDWSGKLVISIFPLQTSISCPTDIVPDLAIEFDPEPNPIAQISLSQSELRDNGYVLTDVLQPVDFVFSDTQLGNTLNPLLVTDRYYAVVINRSGNASVGSIFTGVGNAVLDNSRFTTFNNAWVDIPEEDMWFQVYQDAAKVADGLAYDNGLGVEIDKTTVNDLGVTVDFSFSDNPFADSGKNVLNTAVIQAIEEGFQREQDERTGNSVFSRQQYEPSFSFVTSANLATLEETSEPLIIGCAADTNPKDNPEIAGITELPGLVKGDMFTIIAPTGDLLTQSLIGSTLIPNDDCDAKNYRIFRVLFCVDGYGDVNGDGYIDSADAARASELVGESLSSASTQQKIVDGYISTLEMLRADVDGDGYITSTDVALINQFIRREINTFPVGGTFNHLELQVQQAIGRFDGYFDCGDGYIRLDGYLGRNIIPVSSLSPIEREYFGVNTPPQMDQEDPVFDMIPYVPIPYRITPQPFWQPYLLAFSSEARLVPVTFTFDERTEEPDCSNPDDFGCTDRSNVMLNCDPGRNDFYLPDNLIMRRGQFLNPDGTSYSVDFEVATIILQLPEVPLVESNINVFEKLIADFGGGKTAAGFDAFRFSDCTTVGRDALARDQLRFGVAIQSFNPNLDGYTEEDGYAIIIDDIIGVFFNESTGVLTLTIRDLSVDPVFLSLVTKIQITVYMKKAGFRNSTRTITPDQIQGLLS